MFQTEGENSVGDGGNIMDTGLGRSPAPDQRGTQETSGDHSGEALSPRTSRPIRQVKMKELVVHAYQWFISDWTHSEKAASMSLQERGLYRELLDLCYAQGSVSSDESTLIKLTRSERAEFLKAWPKVKQCFYLGDDNRYRNARVDAELSEMREHRKKKSDAGKKGNDARWNKSDSDPLGIADASQGDSKHIAPHPHPLPHPQPHPHPHPPPPESRYDMAGIFLAIHDAYPEHRRDKSHLAQSAFVELMAPLPDEDRVSLLSKILDGIERGRRSADWSRENGQFVPSLKNFLRDRLWTREYREAQREETQAERCMRLIREQEAEEARQGARA